ncbi:hypothetical protein [Aquabacterium sp.]|uniref:hypothetical protein n=1 Tax=Aquabacterium sp. TaxID=1872578 RepID=UPI002C320260|nr:hypothetical protein [Aquabacterium sp.]HSW04721.1 hypothetical protein [Aquabacterium sp.]
MNKVLAMSLRVSGAVLGGYAFSAACVALAATALPRITGMARSEAVLLSSLLGFLLYLVALLWAFAERATWRVWAVFVGGAAVALLLTFFVKSH